jgi:hypothetical protein
MKKKLEHNFVFDLINSTKPDDLNYIYRGEFNSDITNYILSLAEKNIIESKLQGRTKKRVFHIMVESIQNITRHQDFSDENLAQTAFFSIQKQGPIFYVTTGNIINNNEIPPLEAKLKKLNNLSPEELTKVYLEILNDGQISSKGGAGLGLIEIVRKSGNRLDYDFVQISDTKSFIYMHSFIDTSQDKEATPINTNKIYTFNYIKSLHQQIIKENILLIYSNIFEQNSLVRLISVLQSQKYNALAFKKRIISAMVELLQNIILHGRIKIDGKTFSPGIFYISKKQNIFYLNAVNYIRNEKIKTLKEKLETLNSLTDKEVEELYNEHLFDFSGNHRNAGLGLIELRMKSKNTIDFKFFEHNNKFSLFYMRVKLIDNTQ